MFNDKQIELSNMLFEKLNRRFPEIELDGITEAADNPNRIWVNVVMPDDEDRQIELLGLAAEISTDILMDYGYSISIIPAENWDQSVA